MVVLPAMNTIWFWFRPEFERRLLHGTPEDVMRKYAVLNSENLCSDGLEVFLIPSKLISSRPFDYRFFREYSKLKYKTVHIGDSDPDFLDRESTAQELTQLAEILFRLEAETVIIHAHHLRKNRMTRRKTIASTLESFKVLIENNGFDNAWGCQVNSLVEILSDCPEFDLCFDIAHVKDFPSLSLRDFVSNEVITSRIREIHCSYSMIHLKGNPYKDRGFNGEKPYHGLFSMSGRPISHRTKSFIQQYPIVLEGIVPPSDTNLSYLKREFQLLKN
jgi:hypothetical protein